MKLWKPAFGLAILAAIAAPFAAGTWQPHDNAQNWIALTPEARGNILARLESSKNCRFFETQVEARDVLGLKVDPNDILDAIQCHREQDALRDGGEMQAIFSLPRYLAINGAVALAGGFGIFSLAMALLALLRYRRPNTSGGAAIYRSASVSRFAGGKADTAIVRRSANDPEQTSPPGSR